MQHVFCLEDCINFTCEVTTSVVFALTLLFCLFVLQTVLRIWDCLFYEGSKILFRVALTLIRHNEALIQQAQSLPDVCQTFKQITAGPFVEDCHTFMQVIEQGVTLLPTYFFQCVNCEVFCVCQRIFTEPGSLPTTTLTKLRATCQSRIIAEEP